ncbi:hypothetical protein [Microbulbifer thermotolerans]|uniref:Uncharacterized protein n=1 Tax=Microbulbifer thermotolerans TaxID=252514 RepID=A0A143HK08_MICTH|nr:hypothetical protein [Microbulbifer thermotolerans]AMX01810.1 hypothetical protein A3224_03710 [Microbulbifer thermotolerans]MCX2781239.1 hypothetical protein [Microbulbifer thermotolerans]MCX2783432.1 hypothetical protein [Microbulbifer thermotolerans]MCX2793466.1 hypothetical protein [Microbulbifer thermotolerans]MCX2802882.1 hypothetical protein [Microbulbifer thermotolerans]
MTELLESLPLWLWFVLALSALFVARKPVHQGIFALARFFHQSLRLGARAVANSGQRLQKRNREVLLAAGREAAERHVEREFDRIEATMKKELAQYPVLHRKLCEQLTAIDEDYVRSAEVPPEPTNWAKAIKAVAEIPAKSDPVVGDVLETIHHSMRKAESKALEAYRESARERHQLLKRMMPSWRSMLSTLGQVNKSVDSVIRRAKAIDGHMARYEEIQQGSDRALRMLSSSSLSQFFISAFVLAIAVGGALINFHLIARPMMEMVGGTSYIGNFKVADISALVIILVEITLGLFLMECLRITRLFPVIGALSDKLRTRMLWAAFGLLFFLACVEAGLAFMREILMQEDLAVSAQLRGAEVETVSGGIYWITTAAQMGMGFILPFALTFVAIPLENFIASARTVIGLLAVFFLRALSVLLRLGGIAALRSGSLLVHLYDIVIFLPLWLESLYLNRRASSAAAASAEEA